ncbi:hypothetical protein BDD43_2812 [Mucilaginibacter gracilis]|uniref:Uncharacterized protein n=1 Tax=Mucilaginibacter gracilis TaxID=423350 RepID=A0A495J105_9SPHI|nr:hypothetical protein BDD43_2812 [Mucilaginibacter gracilis]
MFNYPKDYNFSFNKSIKNYLYSHINDFKEI